MVNAAGAPAAVAAEALEPLGCQRLLRYRALGGEAPSAWLRPGTWHRGGRHHRDLARADRGAPGAAALGELEGGVARRATRRRDGYLGRWRRQLLHGREHQVGQGQPREVGVDQEHGVLAHPGEIARSPWQPIWKIQKTNGSLVFMFMFVHRERVCVYAALVWKNFIGESYRLKKKIIAQI